MIVSKLQEGLRALALSKKVGFKSLSSTLLFVYVRKKKKTTRFIAGHIGDGIIGIRNSSSIEVLSHPQKGEYASSTIFLTSSKAGYELRVYTGNFKGNAGFLLLSDGTADSLYRNRDKALAPGCEIILSLFDRFPQKRVEGIIQRNLEQVFRTLTLDDCSIVALGITGKEKVLKGKT